MLRTALGTILLALVTALPAGNALAGTEADCWVGDSSTVGSVKKVLDFVFNSGDGKIYCATGTAEKDPTDALSYSDVFYKRAPGSVAGPLGNQTPADPAMWDGPYFLRSNRSVGGDNASGAEMWTGSYRPRVLPLLVAFNGKVYAARLYKHWFDNNQASPGTQNFYYWEWRVVDTSTCVKTSANTTDAPVLQVRGSQSNQSNYSLGKTNLEDGYLFTDGANLYWGGGGGIAFGQNLPNGGIQNAWGAIPKFDGTLDTGANETFEYVYSFDGANWVGLKRGMVTPVMTDPNTMPTSYLRGKGNALLNPNYNIPMAMPNGYRLSHIIGFDGKFWDYYGSYGGGPTFTFTPYNPDVTAFTEPWGKFQMGTYGNSHLFRIIFNRKGDKNMIAYHTAGTGTDFWVANGGALPNFFAAGINDGTKNHIYNAVTNPNPAPYWRACAGLDDNDATANKYHNGVYCTYSLQTGPTTYESGVYRYFPTDGSEYAYMKDDGVTPLALRAQGWTKVKSTNDARVYTGAISINPKDGIYVGTSNGIVRRGIRLRVVPTPPGDPGDPYPDLIAY